MGLEQDAGRTLLVGLPGPDLDEESAVLLERLRPGGVILFRRNLDTIERWLALSSRLHDLLPEPAVLAIDQEGGRVSRLEPWVGATPGAAELAGRGGDSVSRFGKCTGAALAALGLNLDFAPVVDLCPSEAVNGIGDRSFGTDPRSTTALAGSFLEALQQRGVAGCLKHFPGLGDTPVDSHHELPTCTRTLPKLEEEDLIPFRTLGRSAACIMVGHGYYPALEEEPGRPATLSGTIIGDLLRRQIGFDGLVVSDDMEMGAVAPLDRDGSASVAAMAAGCDLLLYCSDLERALKARDALYAAAADDDSFASRLSKAARAVRRTAARWPARRADAEAWELARKELQAASKGLA